MQPDDVVNLLESYRENKARYNTLYINAMQMAIQINAETRRVIADSAIQAQQYKDTPHSGRVSKPVEDLVIRCMDGFLPDQLRDWMAESEEMQKELRTLETNIAYVDTWLEALTDKERSVITDQMIDGYSFPELASTSARKYGYHISAEGLRGIKRKALQKIYDIAK